VSIERRRCVIPTGALLLSVACAKILSRSPADAGAGGDVGHVLSAGRAAGHQRGNGRWHGECTSSWLLPVRARSRSRAKIDHKTRLNG